MTRRDVKFLTLAGFVLLGSVGMAAAEPDDREVVRAKDGQIVHIISGSCVRSKGVNDHDVCAPPPRRVVQQEQTIVEERKTRSVSEFTREERTVYFVFDRFDLSLEAKERLDALANALKTDQSVQDARLVGYADRIGSLAYNDKLSQKRAETVRDYLIASGYTNAHVTKTRWVGKTKPSTNCPAAGTRQKLIACLQNDRRVEVEIGLRHDGKMPDAQ